MRSQAGSLNPGECCSRALRSGLAESPPPQQKLCSTGALAAVWKPPLTQNKKQKKTKEAILTRTDQTRTTNVREVHKEEVERRD